MPAMQRFRCVTPPPTPRWSATISTSAPGSDHRGNKRRRRLQQRRDRHPRADRSRLPAANDILSPAPLPQG